MRRMDKGVSSKSPRKSGHTPFLRRRDLVQSPVKPPKFRIQVKLRRSRRGQRRWEKSQEEVRGEVSGTVETKGGTPLELLQTAAGRQDAGARDSPSRREEALLLRVVLPLSSLAAPAPSPPPLAVSRKWSYAGSGCRERNLGTPGSGLEAAAPGPSGAPSCSGRCGPGRRHDQRAGHLRGEHYPYRRGRVSPLARWLLGSVRGVWGSPSVERLF